MAEVIRMPRMSDTMTEGVIVSWQKKVGDKVKTGDLLAEVETDKATMDLESPAEGTLLHIGVQEGSAVPINAVIAIIGEEGEDFQSLLNQEGQAGAQSTPQQQQQAPASQPAQASSTQASSAQPSPAQPTSQTQPQQVIPQPQPQAAQLESGGGEGRLKASPLARNLAKEKGIPLEQIQGSGDQGRIVRRDIENFQPAERAQEANTVSSFSAQSGQEGFQDIPVSQMRKTIARRLAESKFSAPHFYLTIEVNMGRAMQARKSINEFLGAKVSFNDIIIKAAAAALRRHPKVNGSWLGDKLRYYQHIHIGVAIAVEEGLVVPVLRFADTKPISQISQEVKEYGERARNRKLQPLDYEGNTFTISNLGMFGIEEFTAIINPPDACILAVGAIQEKPIIENGEVKVGNVMKVTMSCDHRIVDGATGAQFLQTFKQYLEEPVTILA